MRLTYLALCLLGCILNAHALTNSTSPQAQPIIIDTDIYSDVDDVGSLTVANVLHNCGLAELRGVVINTNSKYGALAASVINTHFGNGDVPIGAIRPLTNETFFDDTQFSYVFQYYAIFSEVCTDINIKDEANMQANWPTTGHAT